MAEEKKNSGSPTGEPLYLSAGFFRRPHGVRGEIIMDLHTDFPERFKAGRQLFIGERHEAVIIDSARVHNDGMLIHLNGFDTPESVGRFRNQWVYVKQADLPDLPEGQIYQHEVLGMQVLDESGALLGEVTEILETGANDVYVVTKPAGGELLLPAIPAVILDLDAAARTIRVHVLEGL